MSEVEEIITMLHEIVEGETVEIDETSMLFDEGIIDSIAILDLLACIEEKYEIKISSEDLNAENFACASAIASLVKRYR